MVNITPLDNCYYNTEDAVISIEKINEDYKKLQQLYKSNDANFEQDSNESIKELEALIEYLTEQKEKISILQEQFWGDYLDKLFNGGEEC